MATRFTDLNEHLKRAFPMSIGPCRPREEWARSGPGAFRWKLRTDFGARIKAPGFAHSKPGVGYR